MDNESHKNTWNNFTKFVLVGNNCCSCCFNFNGNISFDMIIGSITENKKIEKRVAITPEIVKKYKSLGLEIYLCKDYATHLGYNDEQYKSEGAKILNDKDEINNSNVIAQMNILTDDNLNKLRSEQIFIGVLNPLQ